MLDASCGWRTVVNGNAIRHTAAASARRVAARDTEEVADAEFEHQMRKGHVCKDTNRAANRASRGINHNSIRTSRSFFRFLFPYSRDCISSQQLTEMEADAKVGHDVTATTHRPDPHEVFDNVAEAIHEWCPMRRDLRS